MGKGSVLQHTKLQFLDGAAGESCGTTKIALGPPRAGAPELAEEN